MNPDFLTRWLVIAGLCTGAMIFGWLQGAHHEQIKAARFEAATEALGKAQAQRTAAITKAQATITERANHASTDLLRQSDDYFRLHDHNPGHRPVPGLPDTAGRTDEAAAPASPGAPADPPATCDPADGSADAITVMLWQRWAREQAATR